MYEIWSIRPANLAYEFTTMAEVADWVTWLIEQAGIDALDNHALFAGVSSESDGEFVAQDQDLAAVVPMLNQMESLIFQIQGAAPQLQESAQSVLDVLARGIAFRSDSLSTDWFRGFVAAAIHGVTLDQNLESFSSMTPLDQPVKVESSLKPTG